MAETITSVNNEKIKETAKLLQKKYRDEKNKFLIENFKAIDEAYHANLQIETIFLEEKDAAQYEFLKDKMIFVTEAVLSKISDTKTPPKAVAIAAQRHWNTSVLENASKIALFENIKDAGNLGTILRTAAAFSLDAIILYGETVELYNPKTVRSAVGNLWKTPILQITSFDELKKSVSKFQKIATLPKGEIALSDFTPQKPFAVMFGSEAEGLSTELKTLADKSVVIKMSKTVESLNLSISAGIVFYKLCL